MPPQNQPTTTPLSASARWRVRLGFASAPCIVSSGRWQAYEIKPCATRLYVRGARCHCRICARVVRPAGKGRNGNAEGVIAQKYKIKNPITTDIRRGIRRKVSCELEPCRCFDCGVPPVDLARLSGEPGFFWCEVSEVFRMAARAETGSGAVSRR